MKSDESLQTEDLFREKMYTVCRNALFGHLKIAFHYHSIILLPLYHITLSFCIDNLSRVKGASSVLVDQINTYKLQGKINACLPHRINIKKLKN